jgi:hypothetical protein
MDASLERLRRLPPPVMTAAVIVGTVLLALIGYAIAGSTRAGLVVATVVVVAVLVAAGLLAHRPALLVCAGLLGLGGVMATAGLVLGGVAPDAPVGHQSPDVVGLPLAKAKAQFLRYGPVKIVVTREKYGAYGIVLHVTGFEYDGTFNSSSVIHLQVGGRHLKQPA